jgi:hypothetical protein
MTMMSPDPRPQRIAAALTRWTLIGVGVLALLPATPLRAQASCKLLQPAELEAALKEWAAGGKATPFAGMTDSSSSSGIVLDTCRSEIVRPGKGNLQISVIVVKNLPSSGKEAIRTQIAALAREPQWQVQDAQFDEKTIDNAICTRYGRPGVPAHSVCAIPKPNGYVQVDVITPSLKEAVSMDSVSALVVKAAGRS